MADSQCTRPWTGSDRQESIGQARKDGQVDAARQDGCLGARLLVRWMMDTAADSPVTANGNDNDGRAKMCEASSGTALSASVHVAMGCGALRLKISGPEEVV